VTATLTIVNPPELGTPRGFAHGVIAPAAGRVLFVAGQTATDAVEGPGHATVAATRFTRQFEGALARVVSIVRAAGAQPAHVAHMTVYVTDMNAYRESRPSLDAVWRQYMGSHYPAMSLVAVTALVEESAMVEIEATAVLP
jgi:enamine deaminase RidA (YjgF/YER057c/UK114 family)